MTEYDDNARPQRAKKRIQTAKRNLEKGSKRWRDNAGISKNRSIYNLDEVMYSYERAAKLLEDAERDVRADQMFEHVEAAVDELEGIQKDVQSTHSDYYAEWRNAVDSLVPAVEALENLVEEEAEEEAGEEEDEVENKTKAKGNRELLARVKKLLNR